MKPALKPVNILIADNNIGNLIVLQGALENDNVNIFTCTSSRKALDICSEIEISIAIIEERMPEISGFELLSILKNNPFLKKIVVILMTSDNLSADNTVLGFTNGAVDYLFKPLDLHIIRAKIDSILILISYQREIQDKNNELEIYQGELHNAIQSAREGKVQKENFLANMSHEIRTPLNAIIGITHLMKESSLSSYHSELIKLIDFSSKALLGIVNDILESSQMDAGKIRIVEEEIDIIDLFQTVSELTLPMAADKGLTLECKIDTNVPALIQADGLRLNQILINVINNAIKFTAKGGVELSLNLLQKSEKKVRLELMIKDTGAGISSSSIEQIFDRFEQLEDRTWQKFGGNGLGLSIVKRLVELMGGEININSEIGIGTTFTITNWYQLSVQKTPGKINPTHSALLSKFENVSILLAEDNVINQFVAIQILKSWNISVDVVSNGMEAFEQLMTKEYDLVLMDTHMPVMNGVDATRKIRKELEGARKNVPIISFSASVIQHEKQEAIDAGVDDFIPKPFDPKLLHLKISNFVKKK